MGERGPEWGWIGQAGGLDFCGFIPCEDAPGAPPRRCGAPVAMMPYYLYGIFQFFLAGNAEASHAPPPPLGAGLAQGG